MSAIYWRRPPLLPIFDEKEASNMLERYLLRNVLRRFIRRGSLEVTTADGTRTSYGAGIGAPVAIRFPTRGAEIRTLCHPELAFGEAFTDGDLVVEKGDIAAV